ncbi:hypothetical protein N9M16_00560 [Candidatus Dependentiae bacterium]|nr:hypothetical protein [Candidatus Dependentiae bacterium]
MVTSSRKNSLMAHGTWRHTCDDVETMNGYRVRGMGSGLGGHPRARRVDENDPRLV